MLTRQQRKLLVFLEREEAARRPCPSFLEIEEYMGWSGHKAAAFRCLQMLRERGFIRMRKHWARSIVVLRPVSQFTYFKWNETKKALECVSPTMPSSDTESASALARPGRT